MIIKKAREIEYEDIQIGNSVEFSRVIEVSDIDNFAALTGDCNPLHKDEQYASGTMFKSRVAHGMLIGSLFSTLSGMYLPGKRCLYLSQTLSFKKPVKPGAKIRIKGSVIGKIDALRIIVMKTEAIDERNEILVEGEAKVKCI